MLISERYSFHRCSPLFCLLEDVRRPSLLGVFNLLLSLSGFDKRFVAKLL